MGRRILLAGLAVGALSTASCRLCEGGRRPIRDAIFGGRDTRPPAGLLESPAPPNGAFIPPPAGGLPAAPAPAGGPTDLPPPTIPDTRNYRPGQKELLLPDPLTPGGPSSNRVLPGGPRLGDPARVGDRQDLPPETIAPPLSAKAGGSGTVQAGYATPVKPTAPTGVPGFAVALSGVATGRRPTVDGFDALRAAGYKSVVYLHAAGADVSATKELAEKKGFRFAGVPVDADTLKAGFARFAEEVGAADRRPVYVFDDDGGRTGTLWYVYFRQVDGLGDDAAQVRAAPLGLRDATGDDRGRLWAAAGEMLGRR